MSFISMISAVAENGVIGADNDMPWHISTDLKFFKKTTLGKPVIMGRRTFQSIGKPLPGRTNIVITRDSAFKPEGALVVPSLEEAITLAQSSANVQGIDEIMVIGGGQIYAMAMPMANRLYITRVHAKPEGDTKFPDIREADWELVERTPFERGPKDTADTSLEIYQRRD
ncbi:dihydrofolate reductase [Rhodobacteraceae bacterium RKSG542]|uniref:dihydrofolate reductase n=1 Tax=Pseudovibrio flavus TaxID=2529854 RepID=UPI0012BC3255|nr:dihydrofolate reductase [Pseudovibrio flavus]MTI19174.1 dihydrofolate reductase [Pseudovibrio flavus]